MSMCNLIGVGLLVILPEGIDTLLFALFFICAGAGGGEITCQRCLMETVRNRSVVIPLLMAAYETGMVFPLITGIAFAAGYFQVYMYLTMAISMINAACQLALALICARVGDRNERDWSVRKFITSEVGPGCSRCFSTLRYHAFDSDVIEYSYVSQSETLTVDKES